MVIECFFSNIGIYTSTLYSLFLWIVIWTCVFYFTCKIYLRVLKFWSRYFRILSIAEHQLIMRPDGTMISDWWKTKNTQLYHFKHSIFSFLLILIRIKINFCMELSSSFTYFMKCITIYWTKLMIHHISTVNHGRFYGRFCFASSFYLHICIVNSLIFKISLYLNCTLKCFRIGRNASVYGLGRW